MVYFYIFVFLYINLLNNGNILLVRIILKIVVYECSIFCLLICVDVWADLVGEWGWVN